MYYESISSLSTDVWGKYVETEWARSNNFLKKHVLSRSAHLALASISFIINGLDVLIGLGAGIGALPAFQVK